MSDGPFRDDQEAALARAAALDAELAHEKAENERLRAENVRLRRRRNSTARRAAEPAPVQAAKPVDRPRAKPASPKAKLAVAIGVIVVVGIASVAAWQVKSRRIASRVAYDQAVADRDLQSKRWRAYITVMPAMHLAEEESWRVRAMDVAAVDPRVHPGVLSQIDVLTCRCTTEIAVLVRLPAPAGVAFGHWRDVEDKLAAVSHRVHDYWSKGDWKDDDYRRAPALLGELAAAIDERTAVFAELRRDGLPAVRSDMRAMQAAHLARHGKDLTWWRIEMGFAIVELVETAHMTRMASLGDADAIRRAVAPGVDALVALTKQAPIEIVRQVRDVPATVRPGWDGTLDREDALWISTIGSDHEPIPPYPKRSDY